MSAAAGTFEVVSREFALRRDFEDEASCCCSSNVIELIAEADEGIAGAGRTQ